MWLISSEGYKIGRGKKVDHFYNLPNVKPNNNSTFVEVLVLLIVANLVWWKLEQRMRQLE